MIKLKEFIKKYQSLNVVIKASLWFSICSFFQKGVSIIMMPIFTRLLSTSEYGKYSIYVSWYQIFTIFITLNIHKEIFNKGLIEHNKEQDEYTVNQMGLMIILCFSFLVLYIACHKIINSITGLSILLSGFLIIEVFSNGIISLWTSRKRFSYEYKKISIVTVLLSLLNPIIGIILVKICNSKVEARVLSTIIVPVILSIILLYIYSKKGKFFSNYKYWLNSIYKSIPLLPHYLSLVLLNQSDKLMINYFYDSTATAIYSVAHTAGLLMVIVNESLNNSFVPWAYNKLKNNRIVELKKMIRPLLYIVLFANILLIWIAPECVYLMAAPEYSNAIWSIVPIAVSVYCTFIYTLFVDIEIYYEGNVFVTIGSIIAACINVLLNYLLIPKIGYIAAAYTTLISYFTTMIIHYIFMVHILKKKNIEQNIFNEREIMFVFLLLIIFSALALITYNYFFVRYLFVFVLLIIIYFKRNTINQVLSQVKRK